MRLSPPTDATKAPERRYNDDVRAGYSRRRGTGSNDGTWTHQSRRRPCTGGSPHKQQGTNVTGRTRRGGGPYGELAAGYRMTSFGHYVATGPIAISSPPEESDTDSRFEPCAHIAGYYSQWEQSTERQVVICCQSFRHGPSATLSGWHQTRNPPTATLQAYDGLRRLKTATRCWPGRRRC